MTVESILRIKGTEVTTARPDESIRSIAKTLAARRIGAIVISRDGHKVDGILSERDVVRLIAESGDAALDAPVETMMTRTVVTCGRRDGIESVMATMTARRIRHVPVVEDGALAGIISIGDVVKSRLEEVEHEAQSLREYISGY